MDVRTSTLAAPVVEYAPRPATPPPQPSAAMLSDRVLALADRHRRKLFVALLFMYLLGFNAQWRVEPDSALYLTVGRNLAEGHGYTYHGQPHHLAYPGLPLLFSGIFKLFGSRTLVPSLVVMLLLGAATLALTYRLFFLYAGRPTAVLMTFGLKRITLGRSTGGRDNDRFPGDEVLEVVVEPRDESDHVTKAPGCLQIYALEVSPSGERSRLASPKSLTFGTALLNSRTVASADPDTTSFPSSLAASASTARVWPGSS